MTSKLAKNLWTAPLKYEDNEDVVLHKISLLELDRSPIELESSLIELESSLIELESSPIE